MAQSNLTIEVSAKDIPVVVEALDAATDALHALRIMGGGPEHDRLERALIALDCPQED